MRARCAFQLRSYKYCKRYMYLLERPTHCGRHQNSRAFERNDMSRQAIAALASISIRETKVKVHSPYKRRSSSTCIGRESNPGLAESSEIQDLEWQRPILPLNHQCWSCDSVYLIAYIFTIRQRVNDHQMRTVSEHFRLR